MDGNPAKAAHYRNQALVLRTMAKVENNLSLHNQLLCLADTYDIVAAYFSDKREVASGAMAVSAKTSGGPA
jgi:hypothetical protein